MSKNDKQKKMPVYMRVFFWVCIVLGCAVVVVLVGNYVAPLWQDYAAGLGKLPVVGDRIASLEVGAAFFAAIVGIVLSQFLGSLMRGVRRL